MIPPKGQALKPPADVVDENAPSEIITPEFNRSKSGRAAPDTELLSQRCVTLRKLGPLVEEAFRNALAHEGDADFRELDARYHDLETHYDQLARDVWATPVASWRDVVERAELAYAYADQDLSKNLKCDDPALRATAELAMAILTLARGEAWRRKK
jgi:hypothetical protein